MNKFEVRIFQGSRSATRRSRSFTIQSEHSLDNIAEIIQKAVKGCDTRPELKDGYVERKEAMCHMIGREGEKPLAWKN